MALGDSRRSSGRANSAGRQAIGTGNAAERQAIQTNNTNERRGSSIQNDLNSLIRPEKQSAQLRSIEPRGAVTVTRGSGTYTAPKSTVTGGGVASPFTEKTKAGPDGPVPDRVYYASGYKTSDGLFILPAIQTQNMTDANGAEVVFQFANPEGSV